MRVAIIQNNPVLGAVAANLAAVGDAIGDRKFDLLVLPELFASGYYFHSAAQVRQLAEPVSNGPTVQFLVALAGRKNAYVCGGLPELANGKIYNSALLVGPQGLVAVYRKLHLFYEEKLWFEPGDSPLAVNTIAGRHGEAARVGMLLCYDWRFPEVARVLALQGAQLLLHPANLVQPYAQAAMVTRCLENRVYALTANRVGEDVRPDGSRLEFTGRSQAVGPDGEVLAQAAAQDTALLELDLDPARADDKTVTEHNHLLDERRPEMYLPVTAEDGARVA